LEVSDVLVGALEPVTITCQTSHCDLAKIARIAWNNMGVPRDLLPICESNADYYCMDAIGKIVYWSHNGWESSGYPNLATWICEVWLDD
jgi:hypothetical protein